MAQQQPTYVTYQNQQQGYQPQMINGVPVQQVYQPQTNQVNAAPAQHTQYVYATQPQTNMPTHGQPTNMPTTVAAAATVPANVEVYKFPENEAAVDRKYRNLPWLIAFWVTIGINCILALLALKSVDKNSDIKFDGEGWKPNAVSITVGILVAIIYTGAWMYLVSVMPRAIIKVSIINIYLFILFMFFIYTFYFFSTIR